MDDKAKIEALTKALQVVTRTEHIRAYLAVMDPKALEQAEVALEVPEFLRTVTTGLPDLRDMQIQLSALKEYVKATEPLHGFARARALLARMNIGMQPLAEREDRINEEERRKEARKRAMEDH